MQLQELKKLIEYDALSFLMATRCGEGWVIVAVKKESEEQVESSDCTLNLARSKNKRVFKTLDAVSKLVAKELYNSRFTVC